MYRMFGLMLLGVCVLSSGCASIINGTTQGGYRFLQIHQAQKVKSGRK